MEPSVINLWPPSEDTRKVIVEEMTKRLSSPSLLSARYGILTTELANKKAMEIEEKVFSTANEQFNMGMRMGMSAGLKAVKFYSNESRKLMEELIKKGPPTFFDLPGKGLMEAKEAKELLKPLTELGNSYTKLSFSNRSFGLGAAEVAWPILISLRDQLTEVDISNITTETPKDEVSRVLSIFSVALGRCALKSLNLSNNAIGDEGVLAFLRDMSRLEKLYLVNVGISTISRDFCFELKREKKLKVLHLGEDMIDDEGCRLIGSILMYSPSLEDFRCSSSTNMGPDGALELVQALKHCTCLEKLNLSSNWFDDGEGCDLVAITLAESLAFHGPRLTEINLSDMGMEDHGVIALANVLKENAPLLKVLNMGENNFTTKAVSVLADCISTKEFLTKLNLSKNNLKDQGAIEICKALEEGHCRLKEVDLSTNSIRMDGARHLAKVVVHKPEFQILNINGNYLSGEGIDELREILKKTPYVLGPLDENDPAGDDDELDLQLKNLEVSGDN